MTFFMERGGGYKKESKKRNDLTPRIQKSER